MHEIKFPIPPQSGLSFFSSIILLRLLVICQILTVIPRARVLRPKRASESSGGLLKTDC